MLEDSSAENMKEALSETESELKQNTEQLNENEKTDCSGRRKRN